MIHALLFREEGWEGAREQSRGGPSLSLSLTCAAGSAGGGSKGVSEGRPRQEVCAGRKGLLSQIDWTPIPIPPCLLQSGVCVCETDSTSNSVGVAPGGGDGPQGGSSRAEGRMMKLMQKQNTLPRKDMGRFKRREASGGPPTYPLVVCST